MEDPSANPSEETSQQTQQSQETQPEQNNYNTNCNFCNVILYGGMDDNNLMHCQNCHQIWDGNAQCLCHFYD